MIKVFYHYNCVDGNACVWIMSKVFADKTIEYYGIAFGSDYEAAIFNNVEPKDDVFFLDFSPTEKVITTLLAKDVARISIIDHHLPIYNLTSDKICSFVDDSHCAAYNVFKYFYPQKEIPEILKYIDIADRTDTEAKNYYEITAFIRSFNEENMEESFAFYEKYRDVNEAFVIKKGKEIFKQAYITMEESLGKIHYRNLEITKGTTVLLPIIEADIYNMGSEIDYKLKQLSEAPNPNADIPNITFAYWYEENFVRVNIRSNPIYIDAAAVASYIGETFGLTAGGGHRNAAVARFSFKQFKDTFLIKEYYENET